MVTNALNSAGSNDEIEYYCIENKILIADFDLKFCRV